MAGNKKTTELAVVPSPINGSMYIAKDGTDYQVVPGVANGLATLDASIKLALAQMPTHTHGTADITDLAAYTGFDARYYTEAEVTSLLAGKANTSHSHTIANVTGLQTALDGKQPVGSYAAAVHTHVATDISNSTATGRSVLTAANQDAARDAIGIYVQSGDPGAVADGSLWIW